MSPCELQATVLSRVCLHVHSLRCFGGLQVSAFLINSIKCSPESRNLSSRSVYETRYIYAQRVTALSWKEPDSYCSMSRQLSLNSQ